MNQILNILISTIDERIYQVVNLILEPREDVLYIISHQYTDEKYRFVPKELIRNDIEISQIYGKGITKSRNNALKSANGKIALISDDDVKYTHEYFNTIIEYFKNNPSLDVACFKIKTPSGSPEYKKYQDKPYKIDKSTADKISSIEIAVNIKKIQSSNITFDERFGVGHFLISGGEEYVFITDCLRKRLNVWYYPEYIVEHPSDSTIKLIPIYDQKRVYILGALDARINGFISLPKAFYYTLKFLPSLIKNKKKPLLYLKERLHSSIYILKTNNNAKYLNNAKYN